MLYYMRQKERRKYYDKRKRRKNAQIDRETAEVR